MSVNLVSSPYYNANGYMVANQLPNPYPYQFPCPNQYQYPYLVPNTPPIQQNVLNGDKLVIHTPKEGLVKQNSFLHPNLELRDKPNNEKGVFATGPIKQGEIVCIFVGDILTKAEVDKLPVELQCKTLQLAPEIYQIGSKNPNDKLDAAEHFNHSCDPNVLLTGNNVLVAGRDIQPGEEICYDYRTSDTGDNPDIKAHWKCTCNSKNCSGWIGPDDYKKVIPEMVKKFGTNGMDFVGHYIKQMYKQNMANKS